MFITCFFKVMRDVDIAELREYANGRHGISSSLDTFEVRLIWPRDVIDIHWRTLCGVQWQWSIF